MSGISSKLFYARKADLADIPGYSARLNRRIFINAEILKVSKVFAGEVIAIATSRPGEETLNFALGIAWPSIDVGQDTVYVSSSHILNARIGDGAKVRIYLLSSSTLPTGLPSLRSARDAGTIIVREESQETMTDNQEASRSEWLLLLFREHLVDFKYVTVGQHFEIPFENRIRLFTIITISEGLGPQDTISVDLSSLDLDSRPKLWNVSWDVQVTLKKHDDSKRNSNPSGQNLLGGTSFKDPKGYAAVGGLEKQISQIRDLIEIPLTRPDLFRHFGLKPPKGVLLHGPPGTGKTHLARAIVASTRSSVIVVNGSELSSAFHGETEAKLRDVFREARSKSPCIVVLDEVDALCPRREDGAGGEVERRVVATLLTLLDGMDHDQDSSAVEERVVVIGTTNRPNAIDPALRRPGRFDREIEIGIPDALARHSILAVLLAKTPHCLSQEALRAVASRTHGYVGADLSAVVREAGTVAIKRWLSRPYDTSIQLPLKNASGVPDMHLTLADLEAGLAAVQPSAMREVFVETPQVRWTDIGGQENVKQKLRECIEWPLLHPAVFERLGVRPPKGVLLYGPPGCSKTLTAKALATESGINFIAIKGPELLNKFVGESERAVREIFRKARAASPSIIFFDEIDALGTSRSSTEGGSSHEGVLTTLLNEMDGVQELVGVTVVAATNRPDVIDSALMRPGRLDRILYVGPPDQQSRIDILRIRTGKMAVDPVLDLAELAELTEGCSGAEIAALCQDAALRTMQENMDALHVPRSAFIAAARAVRRQITPETLSKFDEWRQRSGLTSA